MSMTINISEKLWLLLGFWFPFPDLFSLMGGSQRGHVDGHPCLSSPDLVGKEEVKSGSKVKCHIASWEGQNYTLASSTNSQGSGMIVYAPRTVMYCTCTIRLSYDACLVLLTCSLLGPCLVLSVRHLIR